MAVITLTTDFGVQDEYVGVLKGVIAAIAPPAPVIDITHAIAPHDIVGAAFMLKAAFTWFPKGSVHIAVVDPGVGGPRKVVAARSAGHLLLAPDNGLLWPIYGRYGFDELVIVQNQAYFNKSLSRTFHGRDIFAPLAAHLFRGLALTELGPAAQPLDLTALEWVGPRIDEQGGLTGHVVRIDRFGNLITDIDRDDLPTIVQSAKDDDYLVTVAGHTLRGLADSYAAVAAGGVLAIIGSRGCLEIAVNRGSAAKVLGVRVGDEVRVFT